MDFPYKSKNKNKNVAIRDRLKTLLAGWSKFSCKAHEKWSERRLTCAVTLERGDCWNEADEPFQTACQTL